MKKNIFKLKQSDLANNPPRHPGLQDLDLWTEDQMREWIINNMHKVHPELTFIETIKEL